MLIYRFIGLLAQAGADLSVYRFIGLLAQAGADLSVYRFIVVTLGEGLAPEISIYFFYDFFMMCIYDFFMIFLGPISFYAFFMIILWFFDFSWKFWWKVRQNLGKSWKMMKHH